MLMRILKMAVLGFFVVISTQTADAQYRGRGGYGGDRDGNSGDMRSRFGGSDRSGGDFRSRFGGSDSDRDEMRRRFEEMRSRYSSGGDRGESDRGGDFRSRFSGFSGGGFDRGRDEGDRGGDDRSRSDRSRSGDDRDRRDGRSGDRSRPQLYVPKQHDPIGVELPGNYADGDTDGDGQIALVEWRKWRPQEIANFMVIDTNKDGFLTARELVIYENAGGSAAAPAETYAYAAPSATSNSSGTNSDGNRGSDNGGEKASAAEARFVFNALDKDRDGKISSGEWSGSKSVREGFEKAGIKLDLPADSETFLDRYPPYRLVPQLRIPG